MTSHLQSHLTAWGNSRDESRVPIADNSKPFDKLLGNSVIPDVPFDDIPMRSNDLRSVFRWRPEPFVDWHIHEW